MQQYIIDFVNSATETDINEYLNSCGATVIKSFNAFEKVMLVECSEVPPASDIVEHIKDDTDHTNHIKLLTTIPIQVPVLPTEGSKTVTISDQKDWWKVYSGSVVDLDSTSFQLPLSGAGSVVYLLDSGIKLDHPEFEGADIECLYSLNDDFIDRKGHGTALASVIVGKTCGITNAKLKVVKLFDADVPTRLSDFLSAMDAIYNDFATNTSYGIMNCSWATARNEYIEAKMQTLFRAGIQIVVASGNDGSDIGNVTPAAMPEAIVVGAYNASLLPCDFSDYTGTSAISVTSGSTNGGKLSGWAPGEDIYAAKLDGGYGFSSGTSMSAAIHSAIIAYNVTLPTYQFDEEVNAIWNNATRNNVSFMAKKGLLMLDDPKYQNSPNLVSMLVTDMLDPYKHRGPKPKLFAAIFAGVPFRTTLFNPMHISSVTLHDPLPSGMSINNHGILSGYIESVAGDKETHYFSLSVTDVDGNTSDADLEIAILKLMPYHTRASYDVNAIIPYELNENDCYSGESPQTTPCDNTQDCFGLTCPLGGSCQCDQTKELCKCL
jgi:subtilisin family serine protease